MPPINIEDVGSGDNASVPSGTKPPTRKVVNFVKNDIGEFVDDKGNAIDKSFVLTMYKIDEKGEIVDDTGKPIESVNVVVEEQPGEEYSVEEDEDDDEEDPSSEELDAEHNRTIPCQDDEANEIALNRAMERMLKTYGEEALTTENIWQIFLRLLEEESFTKAFEVLLRFGDDFYFLRGCILTGGKILRKLHKRVAQRVLKKLCLIRMAGTLDALSLHFIERGIKNNYLDVADFETNQATLEGLKTISNHFNNAVKDRAEYLYTLVTKLIDYN